jgi:hypothetical protein
MNPEIAERATVGAPETVKCNHPPITSASSLEPVRPAMLNRQMAWAARSSPEDKKRGETT